MRYPMVVSCRSTRDRSADMLPGPRKHCPISDGWPCSKSTQRYSLWEHRCIVCCTKTRTVSGRKPAAHLRRSEFAFCKGAVAAELQLQAQSRAGRQQPGQARVQDAVGVAGPALPTRGGRRASPSRSPSQELQRSVRRVRRHVSWCRAEGRGQGIWRRSQLNNITRSILFPLSVYIIIV